MVKPISFVVSVCSYIFVLALVTACDSPWDRGPYEPYTETSEPITKSQREARALETRLTVYPGSTDQAPKHDGQSPFGVMVGFPSYGTTSYCSVSHFALRKVVLASHCVKKYTSAEDYFFVFFDRSGSKKVTQGKTFLFRGDPDRDDILVIETDDRDNEWDIAKGKPEETAPLVKEDLGKTSLPITIWAFDPSHREMAFRPRHCTMYRPSPKILVTSNSDVEHELPLIEFSTDFNFFVDSCDRKTEHGNSGALISAQKNLAQLYGVLDGSFGLKSTYGSNYKRIEYIGSDGKRKEFTPADDLRLFHYGTLFEHVLKKAPGTL